MTEKACFQWIKNNLGPIIRKAIADSGNVIYTEDWLAAMAYRETGIIMLRNAETKSVDAISRITKGDYSQRPGEIKKDYHGFGYWQIDVASFPDFVRSGDWQDPYQCCMMAIKVLEGKRRYIEPRCELVGVDLERAITAAYNCGEGNVIKAIKTDSDIDSRTHNKDYSRKVFEYRKLYCEL